MKFKVGDKVRILDGSQIENYCGWVCGWVDKMARYIGKVGTISREMSNEYESPFYKLSDNDFIWDERGLELVESETDTHDKFDWEAFKRGDVTVTFRTNESQTQFLKRCETHGLKWATGDNPTLHSYWNVGLGINRDGTLGYGCSFDSLPMAYDWDSRKYIKRAENPNTDWTAEEIEQAKELSRKLLCKIFDDRGSVKFFKVLDSSCVTFAIFYNRFGPVSDIFKSKSSGSDKFNEWIGKCVCLCKATQTPIPSFILDKNKKRK